jgi:hypothetical protein
LHRYARQAQTLFWNAYSSRCETSLDPTEISQHNYYDDGVLGYVRTSPVAGFVPLHRYRRPGSVGSNPPSEYAYTYLRSPEVDSWYASQRFQYDGVSCYVPNPNNQPIDTAELRVSAVICMDPTDEIGDSTDNIQLGGTIVDGSGQTSALPTIECGRFHAGNQALWGAGQMLNAYYLHGRTDYPWTWCAALVLAEKDHGGLNDFLQSLLDQVEAIVSQEVAEAAGSAVGGAVGSAVAPGVGTAVGAVVGYIVGYAIDQIYGVLMDLWNDDIFKPQMVQFVLTEPDVVTGEYSSVGQLRFTGFDGEYIVIYNWHMYTR